MISERDKKDVFRFGPEDKVTFDQLPEQIRERYPGFLSKITRSNIWLRETTACLQFSPESETAVWATIWEKTKDGWILVEGFMLS